MPFLEERLSSAVGYPSNHGHSFPVETHETKVNDYSVRFDPYARANFQLQFHHRTHLQMLMQIVDLFNRCGGTAGGFRVRSKMEWSTNAYVNAPTYQDQYAHVIDAVAKTYQMYRWYGTPSTTCPRRKLLKIVAGTVLVSIKTAGVWTPTLAYTVNVNTGVITMTNPVPEGSEVWFGCEFDIPVKFVTDLSGIAYTEGQVFTATIDLRETLNPEAIA